MRRDDGDAGQREALLIDDAASKLRVPSLLGDGRIGHEQHGHGK